MKKDIDLPHFMKNPEWYELDHRSLKFVLTKKATKKARRSFIEWQQTLKQIDQLEELPEDEMTRKKKATDIDDIVIAGE